jgi:hypothetical protein
MEHFQRATLFKSALRAAGLQAHRWESYPHTVLGLHDYMEACFDDRRSWLSADELVTPWRHPELTLLPEPACYPGLTFLAWVATQCRGDEPIYAAWVWRPLEINAKYGDPKVKQSAHLQACAIDLDFQNPIHRDRALVKVLHPLYNSPVSCGMGIGVGRTRVHVDFFSDTWRGNGRNRWWAYQSFSTYRGPVKHRAGFFD